MSVAAGFEEFVEIVECGSLTKAAERLGLPRPTLSRRLGRLEERLGVRLLRRTTRQLKLTEQGELLFARARGVVHAAREVEAEVRRLDDVPRGRLRVSTPMGVPQEIFGGWMVDFLSEYPEVSLEIVATATHVDLVKDGFDVALRTESGDDGTLIARRLVFNRRIAVASPEYLAEHGTPASSADLASHNCIIGHGPRGIPRHHWPLRAGGTVRVQGSLVTNNMGIRVEAARRHLGIAIIIQRIAQEALNEGVLVQVLPQVIGQELATSLVYPDREFLDAKVRAFVDFFAQKFKTPRRED